MTTGYISGPMKKIGPPDYNYATFNDVELAWIRTNLYSPCYNPAKNFNGDKTLSQYVYLAASLRQVLDSDIIVLLPGWQYSEGARLEVTTALATGKRFEAAVGNSPTWDFVPCEEWEIKLLLNITPGGEHVSSPRGDVLDRAKAYVCGDRNVSYGPPTQDFRRTADLWNAFGFAFIPHAGAEPQPIVAHHIANAMILLKQSRLAWQPDKRDSWDDTAGYAACGYETTLDESEVTSEDQ